jgi:hypothetical protein
MLAHADVKRETMYIKLQNNIINLDLIKKVTEVKAYYVHGGDFEEGNTQFHHEIGSSKEEARLLNLTINGDVDQTKYVVAYGFEIHYLNEKFPEKVITGTDRIEARKFLEAFATLLNNNQPIIHEIKV